VSEPSEREKTERAVRAMKSQTIWTPTMTRIVRWTVIVVVSIVAISVLAGVGHRVYMRFQPCRGEGSRCVDATHLEMCGEAEHQIIHCASCTDTMGCAAPENPSPGDACRLCDSEGIGGGARPEEWKCSADKRTVMDCFGCFNVWRVTNTCAGDEVCGDGPMGARCVKR
jgi:hypothetical protein